MALYKTQCASCHGEDIEGIADLFPALTGEPFVKNWHGKVRRRAVREDRTTMPALDPGSLKPEQTADLIAHILSISKYPAGTDGAGCRARKR